MARIYQVTAVAAFERIVSDADLTLIYGKQLDFSSVKAGVDNASKYICITNDVGEVLHQTGDAAYRPIVWSHRPFMIGMPADSIQVQFETKHVQCLGDHNQPVLLNKEPDGSYVFSMVKAAWMVYVELAIEHFNTSL